MFGYNVDFCLSVNLQISFGIFSIWIELFRAFDGLNDTFVPLIWFETTTRIDGSTEMGFMVILVSNLHAIMYGLGGFILTCGAIFLLIGTYFYIKQRNTLTHQKFQNKQNEDKIIKRV